MTVGRRRPSLVAVAVLALALALVAMGSADLTSAGAATDNGAATVVAPGGGDRPLRRGGSATPFTLELGTNPVCPGDSASGDFRLQSFMVPASADLGTLTFGANGPVAVEGQFRQPLFATDSSPYVDELTDVAVPPATTGGISGLPRFDFGVFSPGDVPAGDYAIGIACTRGPAGPGQVRTYWSTRLTVSISAADRPAGITWRASAGPTPPPEAADPRSTNADGEAATTTTGAGGAPTTTSAEGAPTTTTADPGFSGTEPSEPSVADTLGQLPLTGTTSWHLVGWGVALLLLGRVIYLLARRPKVVSPADD